MTFHVTGKPEPKGSTKAFVPASWAKSAAAAGTTPRAIVTSDNPAAKGWQQLVAEQAQRTYDDPCTGCDCTRAACDGYRASGKVCCPECKHGEWFTGPVIVAITFALPRPQSAPKRVTHPTKKPDLDKLARLVCDGLTGILFADDAQIVDLRCRKVFADGAPGCDVIGAPIVDYTALSLFDEVLP